MKHIIVSLFTLGLFTVASPAEAASAKAQTPKIEVSAQKSRALCRKVTASAKYTKARDEATKSRALTIAQARRVASELCRFYAASKTNRTKYWGALLESAVAQGKLTKSDQSILTAALVNPSVLTGWEPSTAFGEAVLAAGGETETHANSTGSVVGAVIGGFVGGLLTAGNFAGISAGIAVGGAVGDLAETLADTGDDEAGDDDDDE